MAKTRRAYTGGAASTTTTAAIAASGTTSFTITAYTGWPYGSDPFHIVVEPGTANEEKILVTRTGSTDTTINVYATPSVAANRGADGTSSVAHSSGATVFPVFTALDADEANELASTMTSKGDILTHDASSFERLAVGTNDYVLLADSAEATGLKWGQVDTATLADGAVETAKLNDLAVTGGKLANATVDTKTASYTLVAGDRNKRIVMNNAGATTITVDDAVFAAGDVVWIHNIGAGTCTITAGTATVSTLGELALEQYAGGHLYFTSASAAIFFPTEQGGGGKILQVVRATDATARSTTSTSFVDANISVTITPTAATSTILVVWLYQPFSSAANESLIAQITDSSDVALSGAEGLYTGSSLTSRIVSPVTVIGYSAPATTSATTYKGRFRSEFGGSQNIRNNVQTGQLFALEVSA